MIKKQTTNEIINFLKENIEPIADSTYGMSYRASVYLVDGTYLPCVIFRNLSTIVDLAIKRFKEEQSGKSIFRKTTNSYKDVVKGFVAKRNLINECDIAKVETSKYAFPIDILDKIKGETTMGWTGFTAKMKDEKIIGFGTPFSTYFFQLPENYTTDDIVEIISHSYVLKSGELCFHKVPFSTYPENYKDAVINRECPFFECYLENL